MKHERTCTVCGTVYEYCGVCSDYKYTPTWKSIYCSEKCRTVFKEIEKYKLNEQSASDTVKNIEDTGVVVKNITLVADIATIKSDKVADTKEEKSTENEIKMDTVNKETETSELVADAEKKVDGGSGEKSYSKYGNTRMKKRY